MEMPKNDIPSFNLWSEPWIELERDGEIKQLSIRDTLLNAHNYVAIYDPSPLVVVGVHRLLVAILQDALKPQENGDLEKLWKDGLFSEDKIKHFEEKYLDRFDLFSKDKPFLQSADFPLMPMTKEEQKENTTVARLFPEAPSGTLVTHYRHNTQDEQVFSPSTCALGLAALPPFMSSGGPGLMPSINGVPPVYVLPGGRTLFESLTASLTGSGILDPYYVTNGADLAWWKRPVPVIVQESKKKDGKLSQVGYLHGLTFPARRLRLYPEKLNRVCSRSGQFSEWCVRAISFRMGESIAEEIFWRDPFVAYRLPAEKQIANGKPKFKKRKKKEKPSPIRPMQNRGKATWREFTGLFLQQKDHQTLRPYFLDQLSSLSVGERFEKYPFRCVAFQTDGKMKFFEWSDYGFDVPLPLLQDPDGAQWTDKALAFATDCASTITHVFSISFGHRTKNSERFKGLKERLEIDYWSNIAGEFRQLVLALGDKKNQQQTLDEWFNRTIRAAQESFDKAADATGDDGDTLRHIVEGKEECRKQLNFLRKKNMQGG